MERVPVSIIMPVHNGAQFVAEAIASVRAQTRGDWELLVVDDCSSDETALIAGQHAAQDARVRMLRTAANVGSSAARNLGLAHRGGRYVAFLDADDLWLPEKLEKQLEFMWRCNASFSFTAYRKFGPDGAGGVIHARDSTSWRDMLKGNRVGCSTVVLDTHAHPRIAFPIGLGRQEDYALWLSLLRPGAVARGLDEPLAMYRIHASSKSARKLPSILAQWRVYRDYERLPRLLAAWYLGHYAVRGAVKALR
jgi:teichuronic acid biosynthesis glycosyltransferase TuaG